MKKIEAGGNSWDIFREQLCWHTAFINFAKYVWIIVVRTAIDDGLQAKYIQIEKEHEAMKKDMEVCDKERQVLNNILVKRVKPLREVMYLGLIS